MKLKGSKINLTFSVKTKVWTQIRQINSDTDGSGSHKLNCDCGLMPSIIELSTKFNRYTKVLCFDHDYRLPKFFSPHD